MRNIFARFRARTGVFLFLFVVSFTLIWHVLTLHEQSSDGPQKQSNQPQPPETNHPTIDRESFNWSSPSPPAWLISSPPGTPPIKYRVAVISHPKEFERRQVIRETIFQGVPPTDAIIEYRFFMGSTDKGATVDGEELSAQSVNKRVGMEMARYKDIKLLDIMESVTNLGMKRWKAIHWANESPATNYDWFFNLDTDSFVRFLALSRRLRTLHPEVSRPREQKVLWAQMEVSGRHWRDSTGVPQHKRLNTTGDSGQWYSGDEAYEGEYYKYPLGIGYLLSSKLIETLTAPGVTLAHNISYPYDDMVVGSWINDVAPDTTCVDDFEGFHDPPSHGWKPAPISWETVVIHHMRPHEMKMLRSLTAWENEWQ